MKQQENKGEKKKYWIFTTVFECPICLGSKTYRERRYDEKPEDPSKRYKWEVGYDWCDVMGDLR